jgi:TctA family transporter
VEPRFTFGRPELFQGISFIPAMIGLFGLSEVLRNLTGGPADAGHSRHATPTCTMKGLAASLRRTLAIGGGLLWTRKLHAIRSSTIGVLVGMLPGAGADIAAWISLAASRRLGGKKTGADTAEDASLSGIADATSANNAALAGSWVPALVFGIPGDSVTAIVIGVLLMKNVTPGPKVFAEQASLVYSIYLIFLLANLVLLPVGFAAIKLGGTLVRVPRRILLPIIVLFCVTGAYALNGSMFDVWIMLAMGLLGFVLERRNIPLGPAVLGIILGGPLEERFIQTLTGAGGSVMGLVNRPVAAVLAAACVVLWAVVVLSMRKQRSDSAGHGNNNHSAPDSH